MASIACKALLWGPVLLYIGAIFWLSSLSHPRVPHFHFSDKILHVILYAGFGFLFLRACQPIERRWSSQKMLLVAFVVSLTYGLTDEFHQSRVPHRSPEFWDWVMDGLGGFLGACFFLILQHVKKFLKLDFHRKADQDNQNTPAF